MLTHPAEWDLLLFQQTNQVRPGDIKEVCRFLRSHLRLDRQTGYRMALSHFRQDIPEQPKGWRVG